MLDISNIPTSSAEAAPPGLTLGPSNQPTSSVPATTPPSILRTCRLLLPRRRLLVQPYPPLAGVGFTLAKWILCIMSGFILLAGVGLFVHEWHHANIIKTSYEGCANKGQSCAPMEAGIEKIKLQRKEFREFWLQGSQLVLLNLFLPTLTAILGYIFGSRELPPVEASSRNTQG
jgi:hypothetical protein